MSTRRTSPGRSTSKYSHQKQSVAQRKARRQISDAIRTSFEPLERRQLLSGGDLDTTLNLTGMLTTDFGASQDQGYATVVQPDGKIVVVGQADAKLGIARYNVDGTL